MGALTSEKPPSGSERSFPSPRPAGQPFQHTLPFAAHFSFCSVSLWGRHLSAPRAVIAQVLRSGAAAQRQAEVLGSWHRAADTEI